MRNSVGNKLTLLVPQGLPAPVTDLARVRLHGHTLYLASVDRGSR